MLDALPAPISTLADAGLASAVPALTARELTVLSLVVDGLTNPQIGERLMNSPRTVQSHVKSLMRKFGVQTRTQLAVSALRGGFVPLYPHDAPSHALAA